MALSSQKGKVVPVHVMKTYSGSTCWMEATGQHIGSRCWMEATGQHIGSRCWFEATGQHSAFAAARRSLYRKLSGQRSRFRRFV